MDQILIKSSDNWEVCKLNTIKFNNAIFQVESYNRNTYFNGTSISSNASCTIITDNIASLNNVAQTTITTLQIYHEETLIYDLQNIQAHIDNINEYLNDDSISIAVNLTFDNE